MLRHASRSGAWPRHPSRGSRIGQRARSAWQTETDGEVGELQEDNQDKQQTTMYTRVRLSPNAGSWFSCCLVTCLLLSLLTNEIGVLCRQHACLHLAG